MAGLFFGLRSEMPENKGFQALHDLGLLVSKTL